MPDPEFEKEVRDAVKVMIAQGYMEEYENADGELVWKLTESGRDYMARLQEHKGE